MRVTFYRFPDHQRGYVLINRSDHVSYRLDAGPITAAVPHDLVHYTVEDALGIPDGIWGAIAGGIVFKSMAHVSGRRPPHAQERSDELKRTYRDRLQLAEALGGFVELAAHHPEADLPRLAKQAFRTLPASAPSLDALAGAVTALKRAETRWQELPIGGELTLNWPAHRRLAAPQLRQPRDHGRGRTGRPRAA
jgi:hypothetical protein